MRFPSSRGRTACLTLAVCAAGGLAARELPARKSPSRAGAAAFRRAGVVPAALPPFQANVQLSAGASNAGLSGNPGDLGDAFGLDFASGVFFPAWADNSLSLPGNPDLPGARTFDVATVPVSVTGGVAAVGTVANASALAGQQGAPSVAVNPNDPLNVVIVSVHGASGLLASRTIDGGANWTANVIATGTDGLLEASGPPSAAFDAFGNLFLAYPSAGNDGIAGALATSTDGGLTFAATDTFGTGVLRTAVATGPGPGGGGSVWITYDTEGGIGITGAGVAALGNIGALAEPSGLGAGRFSQLAVGPAGQVLVTYTDGAVTGPSNLLVRLDADGLGANGFGAPLTVAATNVQAFDLLPAQPNRGIHAAPSLAWDRSGSANSGRVYLVYTDEAQDESNDTDIFLRFSDDDGASWSAPLRLNDDASNRSQFSPRLAVDQSTGNVAATWYDARNDAGTGSPSDSDDTPNTDVEVWGTLLLAPATKTVQFGQAAYGVAEAAGRVTLTVTRTGNLGTTATVNYATAEGTATADADYTAVNGTLTFEPGVDTVTVDVPVIVDNLLEAAETFTVTLSEPTGGPEAGAPAVATITVADDVTVTAPSELTATAASLGSIQLGWTDNSGNEDGFIIERKAGDDFEPLAVADADATTYTDLDVAPGSAYTYRVRAKLGELESANSPEASATITTVELSAEAYTGAEGTSVTITVTRTGDSSGAATIRLQSADGTATAGEDYPATDTTLTFGASETSQTVMIPLAADAVLEGSETFTVTLSDLTGGGFAGAPAAATVTIQDDTARLRPTNLTATVVDNAIQLAWEDHTENETGFEIWRKSGEEEFALHATVLADVIVYTDADVARGVEYTYQVRAVAGDLSTEFSNQAAAAVGVVFFSASTYPASEAAGSVAVTVTRTGDVTEAASVDLMVTNGSATAPEDFTLPAGTVTFEAGESSATVTIDLVRDNLLEATEAFTLSLVNPGGDLTLGNPATASVSILDDPAATAPADLTATVVNAGRVRLTWTDHSENETGFEIERSVGEGPFEPLATVDPDVVTVDDATVSLGASYRYRVRATTGSVVSDWSNIAAVAVNVASLQFSEATATVAEGGAVTLTVTRTGDITGEATVDFTTVSGTATSPADFTAESGTLTFAADETSKTITVQTRSDALAEDGEAFTVQLSNPSVGVALGAASAVTVTITDVEPNLSAPTSLTATILSAAAVKLDWTTSDTSTEFAIERRTEGGVFERIGVTSVGVLTYTDTTVALDTSYTYRVRAISGDAASAPSPEATIRIALGAKAQFSAKKVNFGEQKISRGPKQKKIKIKNVGKGTLFGTVGATDPESPFRVVSGGGSFSLVRNQVRVVVVEFAPTTRGPVTSSLTIKTSDPRHAAVAVVLKGKGM